MDDSKWEIDREYMMYTVDNIKGIATEYNKKVDELKMIILNSLSLYWSGGHFETMMLYYNEYIKALESGYIVLNETIPSDIRKITEQYIDTHKECCNKE